MGFWENAILEEWDNWVCIKSRALGVKVDRRSQSQPACLEQGARERAKVLVFENWTFFPHTSILTKKDFLVILKAKYQNVHI